MKNRLCKMRNCVLVCIFALFSFVANAQQQHNWQRLYDELMVSEEQEWLMNEENYDLLCSLAAHHIISSAFSEHRYYPIKVCKPFFFLSLREFMDLKQE